MMKIKVRIIGILYWKVEKEIVIAVINEITDIVINLFFQFFISSLQSFAKINPIGIPAKRKIMYNKFCSIIYLS